MPVMDTSSELPSLRCRTVSMKNGLPSLISAVTALPSSLCDGGIIVSARDLPMISSGGKLKIAVNWLFIRPTRPFSFMKAIASVEASKSCSI